MTSNSPSDYTQLNANEESYDCQEAETKEASIYALISSGRVYSTIMEEPEEDNINLHNGPLDPILINNLVNVNIEENNDDVNSCEVFDSLLTPPPEADLWRMSGTSCITGVSTNTDCSNDTLAQDMSELSSINSYLSDVDRYEDNKSNKCKHECEYLANNTPKLSPAVDRKKRKKNVSDAISRLEDIELTAKNLLRENSINSNAIRGQSDYTPQKKKTQQSEKKRMNESNGELGKSKSSVPKKKKSSKSCDSDNGKIPVYWLKSDNIKPYISRESYKEDLLNTDDQIRNTYQERDLNEYLDQLDKVNQNNERNDCLSDENLNTLSLKRMDTTQPPKIKEHVKISNKHETLPETRIGSLNKNSTTDQLLEIADLDNTNNNPNNYEMCVSKVHHTHNHNRYVDNHNGTNLFGNPSELQSKIPIMKKSPKVKKKGLKSRKTKRTDKSATKLPNEYLANSCSTDNDGSKCGLISETQTSIPVNISSEPFNSASNSQNVDCNEDPTSVDEIPINELQKCINDIPIASNNVLVDTINLPKTSFDTGDLSRNVLNDVECQTSPNLLIHPDEGCMLQESIDTIQNKDVANEFYSMENAELQKIENDIIADISNNLWNNHSFEVKDDLFFDHVFSPLPPIQEAPSDDYSIPRTPEATSICLSDTNYDNVHYEDIITNNKEIVFPDNEIDKITATNLKNKEKNMTKFDSDLKKSEPVVSNTTNAINNIPQDLEGHPRLGSRKMNNIHHSSGPSNIYQNSYASDETDTAFKIDVLSQYSDEMLLITEAMEKEIKSEGLYCNVDNKKSEISQPNLIQERKQSGKNSYSQPPTGTKFEYNSSTKESNTKPICVSSRDNPRFTKKVNKHNVKTMALTKPPFSTSPIAYSKSSSKRANQIRNQDADIATGAPFHCKQKPPPVGISSRKNVSHSQLKGGHVSTLNEVSRKYDPALAGIDEPSLLEEIQQLLGYGVDQLQNEPISPSRQERITHKTSDVTSISTRATKPVDPPASSTSVVDKVKLPATPPKRTPVLDTASILTDRSPVPDEVPPVIRTLYEFQKQTQQTAPPIPPRPQYQITTGRSDFKTTAAVQNLSTRREGVWSPGTAPVDHSGPCNNDHPDLPSFRDVPPVWTPARGGSASPGSGKREYRKISFDGPTVPKRAHQENREIPRPEDSFAWKGKSVELNNSESLHLPRTLNPTVTILQKKREGLIQDHKAEYLQTDESLASYKPGDKLYTIKKEYESEDEEQGIRKFAVLGSRQVEGVGPVSKEGMPMSLKTGVKSEHQGEWYRRMFDSLHKTKDVRYGGGYMSEPEAYDSDAGITRYAKYDRSKNEYEFEAGESAAPRKTKRYVHQPGRIEDYVPGFSSLSERELKANPHADVKLEITTPRPSRQTFQGVRRLGGGYKESGYDSDSTLVFKKREGARRKVENPKENSEIYRDIQKGGDIPLEGLQRPAPRHTAHPHNKYETSEVNIHYRTPIRVERKDFISDGELARRQEEHMQKVYEQERRKKYLSELEDIERRRHTDNFTPLQKSPIPLNRYDDENYGGLRGLKTPEPRQLAKTLFGFHAQNKRELNLNKGDIITIRRHIDKNWMEGEFRGNIGIFPSNYVEVLPYENFKTTPRRPTEGQGRVRFNFQAQTSMEMSLNKGEIIVLVRRVDENWFEGRIATRKGIFPVSYVDVLQEPLGRDASPVQDTLSRPALPPPHLLFNGTSSANSPYSTMGHQGNDLDNKASLPQLTVNTQQEPTGHRALYNYKPQNDDELELLEGDVVMVMEKCDDGWFVGTSQRTNLFGTFPGNYVEKV